METFEDKSARIKKAHENLHKTKVQTLADIAIILTLPQLHPALRTGSNSDEIALVEDIIFPQITEEKKGIEDEEEKEGETEKGDEELEKVKGGMAQKIEEIVTKQNYALDILSHVRTLKEKIEPYLP